MNGRRKLQDALKKNGRKALVPTPRPLQMFYYFLYTVLTWN